jgi:hypothetical protein
MGARRVGAGAALALLTACLTACGGDAGVAGGGGRTAPVTSTTSGASQGSESTEDSRTSACLRSDGNCLGALAPGDYTSSAFAAFGTAGQGQLSYSVADDSWANALDHEAGYWFQEADAYALSNGDSFLDGVYLFADTAAAAQDYPACSEASDPSVGTDPTSLIDWIRGLPGVRTTPVPDVVTASGRAPGVLMQAKPGARPHCSDLVTVRTFIASRSGALDGYVWGLSGSEVIEAHFEDVGGHTVAILFYSAHGDLSPRLARSSRRLASSFEFTAPAG